MPHPYWSTAYQRARITAAPKEASGQPPPEGAGKADAQARPARIAFAAHYRNPLAAQFSALALGLVRDPKMRPAGYSGFDCARCGAMMWRFANMHDLTNACLRCGHFTVRPQKFVHYPPLELIPSTRGQRCDLEHETRRIKLSATRHMANVQHDYCASCRAIAHYYDSDGIKFDPPHYARPRWRKK